MNPQPLISLSLISAEILLLLSSHTWVKVWAMFLLVGVMVGLGGRGGAEEKGEKPVLETFP